LFSGCLVAGDPGARDRGVMVVMNNTVNAASDPVAYVRSDGVTAVLFKSSDNRIRELTLVGGSWVSSDLNAATGGPLADGAGLNAYVRADRVNAVVYRTADNHVHELSLAKGGGTWSHGDLTSIVGAI